MSFFRKKSPVVGIVVSVFLSFLLFCLLLAGFLARSAVSLVNNMDTTVTTMLEDKTFRTKVAKTIQGYTPEDTVTLGEINQLMNDEKFSETIGEFGSLWMSDIIENGSDPVDAILKALETPDMEYQYERTFTEALETLEKSDEDLRKGAETLAEKHDFELPEEGSSKLEIAIAVVKGTRSKLDTEIGEVTEYIVKTQDVVQNFSFALSLFSTALFVVFNLALLGVFYGIILLLVRHLIKPCLYLGAPYVLVGILLMVLCALDIPSLVGNFVKIPKDYLFVFDVLMAPLFNSGLIAIIIGVLLVGGASGALIAMKLLKKEPEPAVAYYAPADAQEPAPQEECIPQEAAPAQEPVEEAADSATGETAATNTPVCPNCGSPIDGDTFCTNCGARLE